MRANTTAILSGVSIAAIATLHLFSSAGFSASADRNHLARFEYVQNVRALNELGVEKSGPFFMAGATATHFQGPPFFNRDRGWPTGLVGSGWPTFSPHWDKQLRMNGFSGRLEYVHFLEGRITFFGTEEDAELMAQVLSERLGIAVKGVESFGLRSGSQLAIWVFEGTPQLENQLEIR